MSVLSIAHDGGAKVDLCGVCCVVRGVVLCAVCRVTSLAGR